MTQPDQQDDQPVPPTRELEPAFGARPAGAQPVVGEAQPIPQPGYRLRLPFARPRAVWVLLALNIVIFAIPTVLQIIGLRVGGAADQRPAARSWPEGQRRDRRRRVLPLSDLDVPARRAAPHRLQRLGAVYDRA
ncbi:MAG: hypothetical protein IPP13_13840 [Kouleothrix sp.]|nr:hypothetical protein [Kouleothrix sp.]